MTASYPGSVRNYIARVDLVDTVIADNVNSLQEEIKAVETALGTTATNNNPLISTYLGSFATTGTWSSIGDRLKNIEAGLVNGVTGASSPYVSVTGGSTITTATNKGLVLKTGTGSLNLLEAYSSSNVLGFSLDSAGLPKVATANVLYVGSTEYNSLVSATSAASTLADTKIPLSTVTTAGDLIVGSGNAAVSRLARGTSGQSLIMSGTSVAWGTPTDTTKVPLSTVTTAGDLILGSGSGAVTRLGIGTNGQVLTSNGTTATWATPVTSYVSQTNGVVTTAAIASGVVRNTFVRTTTPTGSDGAVGDVWIVYA
jgi:hypothetical protein